MMIAYETQAPDFDQIAKLLQTAGLNGQAEQYVRSAYGIAAYDGEELVGFGGIRTDGDRMEIVRPVILPEYASRQVDENIMKLLKVRMKKKDGFKQ